MEPRRDRRAVSRLAIALAGLGAFGGCASEPPGTTSSPGTTAAGGGGGPTSSTTTMPDPGADAGSGGGGAGGHGAGGFPGGDPGWQDVVWAQACPTQIATHPRNAAPSLRWMPCADDFPGCERAVVDWDNGGFPFGLPFVVRWGDGYRIGADVEYPRGSREGVLYDADGSVLMAWRPKSGACGVVVGPIPREQHVWAGMQAGGKPTAYVLGTYPQMPSSPQLLSLSTPSQDWSATDDTLALQAINGKTLVVYDRLADRHDTYQPHPGLAYDHPFAVADSVLVRYAPAFETFEARIWNRSTHAVETLVSALPDDILDVKGDGQTLVWLRAPHGSDAEGYYLQGDLWTSPFATSKDAVKPTKRRPAPLVGEIRSTAGEGHYALHSPKDEKVHVYRLADMRHWSFGTPPDAYALYDVAYVDARYVYYRKIGTMFRQALDALGPGDPPP
jgi:hypothetical protein